MEIDFILTFKSIGRGQDFTSCQCTEEDVQSIENVFKLATEPLTGPDFYDLIKISFAVSEADDMVCPDWIKECNGKIWVKNGRIDK